MFDLYKANMAYICSFSNWGQLYVNQEHTVRWHLGISILLVNNLKHYFCNKTNIDLLQNRMQEFCEHTLLCRWAFTVKLKISMTFHACRGSCGLQLQTLLLLSIVLFVLLLHLVMMKHARHLKGPSTVTLNVTELLILFQNIGLSLFWDYWIVSGIFSP